MNEQEMREELAVIRVEQTRLANRARELLKVLDNSPRVIPVLCFWRYHVYCETEAFSDTVDEAFNELASMEEEGSASTVGVRVNGHLITWRDHGGDWNFASEEGDARIRESAELERLRMAEPRR